MWLFAFLVSLRSPEFQPHLESLDPFDRRLSMLYFWLSVDHHFHQGSLGPIDDSFEVLGKWLESWLSADPDEDIEYAWQQDIVWAFVASIHERALTDQLPSDCVDLKLLIKRPTFLAVLNRFVGYAKGRRAWSCAQSSIPDVDVAEASLKGWDDFLAGTSYTEKYLALSYDKQRLEHIIRGSKPLRNTSLTPNTGIGSVYPGEYHSSINDGFYKYMSLRHQRPKQNEPPKQKYNGHPVSSGSATNGRSDTISAHHRCWPRLTSHATNTATRR